MNRSTGPMSSVQALLLAVEIADVSELLALLGSRVERVWMESPKLYRAAVRRLLAVGEPLIAYDTATEGLEIFKGDVRLRQLLALALARSGATESASLVLKKLMEQGEDDEETLGLSARTFKDLALRCSNPFERQRYLFKSREIYFRSYRKTYGYYSGINAATLSLLSGDLEQSQQLALSVREQCLERLKSQVQDDQLWLHCTLGESALLLNEHAQAEDWYGKAQQFSADRYADLNSAKRNACLILECQRRDAGRLKSFFHVPTVAVCVGHMVDPPRSSVSRFPSGMQGKIKEALRDRIQKLNIGFGYSSAACGADILFLEALLESRKEAFIVLPYSVEEFKRSSVTFAGGDWGARFDRVLKDAARVVFASQESLLNHDVSIRYANSYLRGLAQLRALRLDTRVLGLAVWDNRSDRKTGGTTDTLVEWKSIGFPFEIIDLAELLGPSDCFDEAARAGPVALESAGEEFRSGIRGLLFADAVGFSKLREHQIPAFVRTFLGKTAELIKSSSHAPVFKNTWGDGMYFVFDNVCNAGAFSLELRKTLCDPQGRDASLPSDMNLRIGLHAGPVYSCYDPIIERQNFVGTHVSRAARIEPITPAGEVFASEEFAALAAAEGAKTFWCEYVGRTPQAKNYGSFPTYVVRERENG